jgi:hypothetical protein
MAVKALMVRSAAVLGSMALLQLGCSKSDDGGSADDGSEGSDSDDGLDGGDPKFDTAPGGGDGSGDPDAGEEICKVVDVIIAVDNSQSMQEEIAALQGPVFDSFPETLLDVGNGLDDFHLAVIDACPDPPYFHNWGKSGDCQFSTEKNYMLSSSATLAEEYACVTDLATAGYENVEDGCTGDNDDEQPANTAGETVTSTANFVENAGFSRASAILFVVAITDEDEQPLPAQTAQEVADKLAAAKGTIDNVVFLGIGGDSNCSGQYGSAEEASMLREITNIFVEAERGVWWDLCTGDLQTGFQEALEVVNDACFEFVPQG